MARGGRQIVPRPPGAAPGPPPPWQGIAEPARFVDRSAIEAALLVRRPDLVIPVPGLRDAAVLVPFVQGTGGMELVFVKRGASAPTHAGEVAFPGGTSHRDDPHLLATALREAEEEIGLAAADVAVLGTLERTSTVATAFRVTPFVGLIAGTGRLAAQPREIEDILVVPVAELLHPDAYHAEVWTAGGAGSFGIDFFEIEGETIWGLTARILAGLFDRVFRALPGDPAVSASSQPPGLAPRGIGGPLHRSDDQVRPGDATDSGTEVPQEPGSQCDESS